jgi:ferredoxin
LDIHQKVLKGRVWAALHMHAGDGNVHTNLPVNSDDYDMLQTAHEAVGRIMALARSLDGVISGEHGIGITKMAYLSDAELQPFADYKARMDPQGHFNKGKLLRQPTHSDTDVRASGLSQAYTPSFGLMGHESLIMQQSDIGAISESIKDCLRCGKCKPVCATHVPRANLLYSPRNKILATSLLIEAFLYEEQTRRGVSIKHWQEFEDVADHCTVCHKCESPCPVKIDFGDVSMNMRNLLRKMGQKNIPPRQCGGHDVPECHQSRDHQVHADGHGRGGLQSAASGQRCVAANSFASKPPPAIQRGHRAHQRAGDSLRQQKNAQRLAQ